jgi:hypothetical protein
MMKKTSRAKIVGVHPKEHDVSRFGIKHDGELVRSYILFASLDKKKVKDKGYQWVQAETQAYINGKKVSVEDATRVHDEVIRLAWCNGEKAE